MPLWNPKPEWKGQDVFIIGGGTSLENFDWSLLTDKLTIGCNMAFSLGFEICKICCFGDVKFFNKYKEQMKSYRGFLFTNHSSLLHYNKEPVIWTMKRQAFGFHTDAFGWNYNTGSIAINLALILGASNIYLLGFDMHLSKEKKANWHDKGLDRPNELVYKRMMECLAKSAKDIEDKFPGQNVFNITDNSSLNVFPKISTKMFWE